MHQLNEATECELSLLWGVYGEALVESLKNGELVLKGKLFEVGKGLVISMTHRRSPKQPTPMAAVGRTVPLP